MSRIYAKMAETKEQFKVGLISKSEMMSELRKLEIELMGSDNL